MSLVTTKLRDQMENSDPSDDINQRFAALIKAEFGDSDGPALLGTPLLDTSHPVEPAPPQPPLIDDFFDLERAIDEVELSDDDFEHWTPPPAPSVGRPGAKLLVGAALLTIAFIIGISVLAGWRPQAWISAATLFCAGGGLIMLLFSLPRHRQIGGDGSQI